MSDEDLRSSRTRETVISFFRPWSRAILPFSARRRRLGSRKAEVTSWTYVSAFFVGLISQRKPTKKHRILSSLVLLASFQSARLLCMPEPLWPVHLKAHSVSDEDGAPARHTLTLHCTGPDTSQELPLSALFNVRRRGGFIV